MLLKKKPEVTNQQSSELWKQGKSRKAMHIDIRTLAAFGVNLLFWSSAFAGIRAGLFAYTPAHVALLRYIVASVVLAGYAALTRMCLPRDILGIALTGFVGITVYHVALNTGEVSVPAGVARFLIASAPIFLALLAITFLRERLRWHGWAGIVLSFVGVTGIALGAKEGLLLDPRAFIVLLAAIAQSLYIIGQKLYLTR
jgi:drug/metabolite transporter (DMT)-like permease